MALKSVARKLSEQSIKPRKRRKINMVNIALEEWLHEASGDIPAGQAPMAAPMMPMQVGTPPDQMAGDPSGGMESPMDPNVANPTTQMGGQAQIPDVSMDPVAPDMPQESEQQDFEQWKNTFFKESVKGDVNKLVDLIHQVRDLELDTYPRKFTEDNLQICFLRQHANIDKASQEVRKLIKNDLDQNNPSVSVVNHIDSVLQKMPELNNVFIKLKGLLGMKGDLHRKYISALIGAVQVGSGGNTEDIIYNERDYSIRISTRYNDRWGKVEIGKWSLREDDPERYLTEPEQKRMQEGSPEEKDVLRRRVVMESIADAFKRRAFIVNSVGNDGTVYTLGWDLSSSLQDAYQEGKLVVKTIQSDNSEAMIDDQGAIIPYVDIQIKYVKETGGVDEDGKPMKEEHDFMERIDGVLFLTAQLNILQEAATSFTGIVLKETPYNGNPSDLRVLQRCVPTSSELLMRQC
jgi:hypothetical protein